MNCARFMISAGAVLFLTVSASAQRKFIPPAGDGLDRGYVMGGPLLKDKDCARDYVKSETMSGLEKRKYIAEFVKYGCGEQLSAAYKAVALETERFTVEGKTLSFRRVSLFLDWVRSHYIYGTVADDEKASKVGWVPESEFLMISEKDAAAVATILKKAREKQK